MDVQPDQAVSLPLPLPSGGQLMLQIAGGAVEEPTTLRIALLDEPTALPETLHFAGYTFAIDAFQQNGTVDNMIFTQPLILVLTYTDADVAGLDEETLTLHYLNPATNTWQTDGITVVERAPAENRITLALHHLTDFALFTVDNVPTSAAQKIYIPIVARYRWKLAQVDGKIPATSCLATRCIGQ